MWKRACGLVLLGGLLAHAAESEPAVLCDFETGEPTLGWGINGLRVVEIATPNGRGLKLVGDDPPKGPYRGFVHRASAVADWRPFRAFAMRVRADAKEPIAMRLQAIGPKARGRLLRRFTVEPGEWRDVVLELKDFRDDGEDQAGSFASVDRILLRWDTGRGEVSIDDLRLLPGDRGLLSCAPTAEDWLRLGFGKKKARTSEGEHFLLLDDVKALSDADAQRLLARLEEGLKVLDERYGVTGEFVDKVPFFLFQSRDEFEEFVPRLGEHFGATVTAPTADGLSIFGVGMSSYDRAKGWDRPVFVHEALHGVVHRHLGVASNSNWIQEGLASAVQTQIHPKSLDRARLAEGFANRGGWIVPWATLFADARAPMNTYPQLLSIMDFLAETRRDALPRVWDAVRATREPLHKAAPAAIAAALGTDVPNLEDEWLAWGAGYYGGKQR